MPRKPLVVLLHGMRTHAKWMDLVEQILKKTGKCEVAQVKFGYFDLVRFWCPCWTRPKPLSTILWKLEHAIALHPGAPLVLLAHSFGSYAISEILRAKPHIVPVRLLLCGSI